MRIASAFADDFLNLASLSSFSAAMLRSILLKSSSIVRMSGNISLTILLRLRFGRRIANDQLLAGGRARLLVGVRLQHPGPGVPTAEGKSRDKEQKNQKHRVPVSATQ